jgi:phosphohistidine phosphatase
MKLYLLRHAEAAEGEEDAARPLTPLGRRQAQAIADFLERAGIEVDATYTSPLVRARQTAEAIARRCGRGPGRRPIIVKALLNEIPQCAFDRWLEGILDAKQILLVGHNPSLSERLAALLGMENGAGVALPKAALACVKTDDGRRGKLRLFLTPKSLLTARPGA